MSHRFCSRSSSLIKFLLSSLDRRLGDAMHGQTDLARSQTESASFTEWILSELARYTEGKLSKLAGESRKSLVSKAEMADLIGRIVSVERSLPTSRDLSPNPGLRSPTPSADANLANTPTRAYFKET